MTHTAQELQNRLDSLIGFVNQAKEQVESGELANLGSLDKDVSQLCNDVESSEPEVAQAVSEKMAEMVSSLEELANSLKTYQENVQDDGTGE
jgi:phage host-nuclease inhibitor protein Gam